MSTGKKIDYCFMSDAMKSLPQLSWLRKGTPVPQNTETARFNATGARVAAGERAENELDVMDWLGGARSILITEEVIGLGAYGKTLTVLSSEKIGQDMDEEDEPDAADAWTPRFRR